MIKRRQVLQAFAGLPAVCAMLGSGIVLGELFEPTESANGVSSRTLLELLRDAVQVCRSANEACESPACELTQSQQMFEVAIDRIQRSVDDGPAFWQACSDSVVRLESVISPVNLYQLQRLREQLANRIIQAIDASSRLA